MIGTIRKHSRWLWAFIITVTVLAFVVFFTPNSGYQSGRGGGPVNLGSIDGNQISREQYADAETEVLIRYFFTHGEWPDRDRNFNVQRETYFRLFLIHKLEEYGIQVSTEAVAQTARRILQSGAEGQPMTLEQLEQRLSRYANAEDFQRFLRHDLGIQQLMSVVGVAGEVITPRQAETFYRERNQELDTQAAFFSGSNYLASVAEPTPDVVGQFYTNRQANYALPERVQVSYVFFPFSNHMAQAETELTNLTELVEADLSRVGTNYTRIAPTREEAGAEIRKHHLRQRAAQHAVRQANQLLHQMFAIEPPRAQNLAVAAQTNNLTVHVTRPFDEFTGPTEFDGGPNFAPTAFRLSEEEPFAEQPMVGEEGLYVIALEKRLPREFPPLEEIREQVVADYKYSQAVMQAWNAGMRFAQSVTNGLAEGGSFEELTRAAGAEVADIPPFSWITQELPRIEEHMPINMYKQVAFSTPAGAVSDFRQTRDGGVVVHVERRLPIDPERMQSELPTFTERIREARKQEAFAAWFSREAQRALRDTPIGQPAEQPSLVPAEGNS